MLDEFFDLEELHTLAKLSIEDEDQEEQIDFCFKNIENLIFNYEKIVKMMKMWHLLLSMDGMNTKHQVLVDIEKVLEDLKNEKADV